MYSFLPGKLLLTRGAAADYTALARFHYVAKRPATFALILAVRYLAPNQPPRCVAVGVLSHPPLRSFAREAALGWQDLTPQARNQQVNRHLRTISRVIVHPQFRSLGLAQHLVRTLAALAGTPLVETTAHMALHHPLFTRSGFRQPSSASPYFLRHFPTPLPLAP